MKTPPFSNALLLLAFAARTALALNFTVSGGQIFTPGFAIVDAPQPGTPLGGDTIEVALDVSADGKLPLPPYPDSSPSRIHNITIFLSSYTTGKNFTITNGTATANNASLGDIMASEPGSTVKHVRWTWPDCLVGDGQPSAAGSARGVYNVSIRQSFRLNGADHYTVFDLPISVTNSIPASPLRPACVALENPLLTPEQVEGSADQNVPVLFAPGDSTTVQTGDGTDSSGSGKGKGLGSAAAAVVDWRSGAASWVCLLGMVLAVVR